jgi:hypothetical protein
MRGAVMTRRTHLFTTPRRYGFSDLWTGALWAGALWIGA